MRPNTNASGRAKITGVALLRLNDHDLEYETHGSLAGRTLVFLH